MSEKDVKTQVLEDLLQFLEDKISEKLKKPGKEELPTEGTLIIAEPTEDYDEELEDEEEGDELDKRLKKLLAKRGE